MSVCENQIASETSDLQPAPPAIDAAVHVSIPHGGLTANIIIDPPSGGGAQPTLEALESALAENGVCYNVDLQTLRSLVERPVYNHAISIATGVAPIDGVDGTAVFQFETDKKVLRPQERADGTVDLHDLGIVENVAKNQVLCVITLPTEGTPGISVAGQPLPQRKGRAVPCYLGKNTRLSDDGTAILSNIDGQVDFSGGQINVNETFFVREDVDNSTGNIKVAGNLVVGGTVLPGFQLEAGQNIEVRGTAQQCVIKAGGSVKLHSGMTGSDLYCEGDLKSRFIENCNIFVKGEIQAEYILNSTIRCGKNLKIIGRIAKIIGGSCVVGQNIEANTVGSPANVKTRLELGTDPAIIERQQELIAQIPKLEKQIQSLKPLITLLRQLEALDRLTEEKRQTLDNVGASYDNCEKLLRDAKGELERISDIIQDKGYGRIVCTGTIFPGTHIVIGAASLSVTDPLNNISLFYDNGAITRGSAR